MSADRDSLTVRRCQAAYNYTRIGHNQTQDSLCNERAGERATMTDLHPPGPEPPSDQRRVEMSDAAPSVECDGGHDQPFASIIIPVYEDCAGIRTTLSALVEQTYPAAAHEIIVVDNGSGDATPDVVRSVTADHDQVTLLQEPAGGSYTARNAGIRAARGSILSFVDADMTADPTWLERVVERVVETDADYLACDVEISEHTCSQSLAERYNRRTAFPIEEYVREWNFAPTCCLTVRRAVIEDVGPFDTRLVSSGDREFGNRVANAGYELRFADDITMTHPPRTELDDLVGKAVRIGRGRYQVREYYPDRYGHPTAELANPLNYTPPLPRSMAAHVDAWATLGVAEKVQFTTLAWLLTLAKTLGTWKEAFEDREQRLAAPEMAAE